jgi:hypothetical protein
MKVCTRGKFRGAYVLNDVSSDMPDVEPNTKRQTNPSLDVDSSTSSSQVCPPEANCDVNLDQLTFEQLKSLYNNVNRQLLSQTSNTQSIEQTVGQNKELTVLKELIQELSTKTSKNDDIVIALEAIVLILFICKPIIMYYIQAKYNAPEPHVRSKDALEADEDNGQEQNLNADKSNDSTLGQYIEYTARL